MTVVGEILLLGQESISPSFTVTSVGAIASGEALGQARVLFVARPVGLTSAQSFGTASLPRLLQRAGSVPSTEAFGTPTIRSVIGSVGVATGEAVGSPTLSAATILVASGYGSVSLDDVAAFPTVMILDAAAFTVGGDGSSAYQQTIDDALVFDDSISSALAFAGAVDDTPGG